MRSFVLGLGVSTILFALPGGSASAQADPAPPSVRVADAPPAGPVAFDTLGVAGLERPVEIRTDRWGIAHIYAETEADLFFAQGYNVARDRLFQLELWRRQATGTLAEVLGPKAVERDLGARLLRYRGDMDAELAHYHPRGRTIIESFVRGINAYVAETERRPELLPVEFHMLGFLPGHWTPEVVVSRHNGLFRNVTSEVRLARLVARVGAERARGLADLEPGSPTLVPDPALDLDALAEDVTRLYVAARAPVRFEREDLVAAFQGAEPGGGEESGAGAAGPAATSGRGAPPHPICAGPLGASMAECATTVPAEPELDGSNNWVLSGARTASGMPILANDPHRAVQLPSLRYWVHLVGPGWNVVGGGEPALPGVSIGHNEHGAWGLTVFSIDQEDLYVYRTDPSDPRRYRYGDGWETMRVERETIAVEGGDAVEAELRFARHGPVLYQDSARGLAYALRAAWHEPGGAPYLASLRMNQARNWDEFREACRWSNTPSENMLWADTAGHIGWQAVGITPLRAGWNGLLPVPGDGRYEWNGYLDPMRLPAEHDPARGWIATANENNLPPGYEVPVGFQWAERIRADRLAEVLDTARAWTVESSMRLQHDEYSIPARTLVPLLRGVEPASAAARAARERLLAWNLVLDAASVPAAIYVAWERRLRDIVGDRLVPGDLRGLASYPSTTRIVEWLAGGPGRMAYGPAADRDSILAVALEEAVAGLSDRLGTDMAGWRYGQSGFKHVLLRHPLGRLVDAERRAALDLGPLSRGGTGYTLNVTSGTDNQGGGASFRLIADTGDWDRSVGTNTPGQSGDPSSPHYSDLFASWATGEYFPVAYSRARVEAVTEAVTLLRPGTPTSGEKQ